MRQTTKILSILLTFSMLLALVACGAEPIAETTATEPSAETETAASETTAAETLPPETTAEETTAEAETTAEETTADPNVSALLSAEPLDSAALASHTAMSLWPSSGVPGYDAAKGVAPKIQAYLVSGATASVVIFPGGGYARITLDSEGTAIAKAFNARGISAFVVSYRVADYEKEQILADGWRAVQFVRYYAESLGLDPQKIAVCGFSAGGHLAMSICEHQPTDNPAGDVIGAVSAKPDACILSYAVVQLKANIQQMTSCNFLGLLRIGRDKEAFAAAEALVDVYSFGYAVEQMPATFLWCGSKDTSAKPAENAEPMAAALEAAGVDMEFIEYEGVGHGVGLGSGTAASGWLDAAVAFLRARGF